MKYALAIVAITCLLSAFVAFTLAKYFQALVP